MLALFPVSAILLPVREIMKNEMKTEFKNQVRSLLSDDAMHYGNFKSNVEQALNEGWTAQECAEQCESDV